MKCFGRNILPGFLKKGATIKSAYYANLIFKFREEIKDKHYGDLRKDVPCAS